MQNAITAGPAQWEPAHHRGKILGATAMAVLALVIILIATVDSRAFGDSGLSDAAYPLLAERVTANQTRFLVYQDADAGFNHGFPSGFFGSISKIHLNTACVHDSTSVDGCSADPNRLDRERGTVMRIAFDPRLPREFAGVNIEEPENWGAQPRGIGYALRDATQLVFDVRSPQGIQVQFGVGGCVTPFFTIPPSSSYTTMSIPINSLTSPPGSSNLCPPPLDNVHLLFTAVTNDMHARKGGTVLLDNICFEPVPNRQLSDATALSFPLGTQTFGVIPL